MIPQRKTASVWGLNPGVSVATSLKTIKRHLQRGNSNQTASLVLVNFSGLYRDDLKNLGNGGCRGEKDSILTHGGPVVRASTPTKSTAQSHLSSVKRAVVSILCLTLRA